MPDERVRAFVAILPAADLHRACRDVAAAGRGLPVRWGRPASVHLTLKFLGDVPADTIPAIHQALRRAAEGPGTLQRHGARAWLLSQRRPSTGLVDGS